MHSTDPLDSACDPCSAPAARRAPLRPLAFGVLFLAGFPLSLSAAPAPAAPPTGSETMALPPAQAGRHPDSAAGRRSTDTLTLPAAAARALPPPPAAARTVIVPDDVERQLGNLGDLLQRMAGVHVLRAGGMGDYLGLSLRGASESQVDVYVNGVLQNTVGDAAPFLSDWDLARVERVEVYKGLAPEHLPGAPLGGAVNIVTRETAQGPGLRGALGAGSFGSYKANGSAELRTDGWVGRVQAGRDQSEGDFPYYDDDGVEYLPGRHQDGAERRGAGDLVRKIRRHNAHELSQFGMDLSYAPPALRLPAASSARDADHAASGVASADWEFGLQARASRLFKEMPAPYAGVDSTVRIGASLTSDKGALHARARRESDRAEFSLDLSGSWLRQAYIDTSLGIGVMGIGYDDDRDAYLDGRAELRARLAFGKGLALSALAAYGATGYFHADRALEKTYPGVFRYVGEGKFTPTYTRGSQTWQASLDIPIVLQEQAAVNRFGLGGEALPKEEWDERALLRFGWQYRLGGPGHPADRGDRWLFAEGGQGARQPSFLEKYGDRGAVLANPSLRPETGWNGSAGLHWGWARASLDAACFAAAQRDLIILEQNAQNVLVYRNAARARILGLEAAFAARPASWARTEIGITAQRAASGGEWFGARRIPFRPDAQASARQTVSARGFTLSASGYYQGLAYPNADNAPSLFDTYSHNTYWQTRCDLELSWRGRHLLVAAGVRNVFDQRSFDFFNFPLPGRGFSAAVQAEL